METLEELYNLKKKEVGLERRKTPSGKWLEVFPSPGPILVNIAFPEFTCRCPRTSHPDFATITIKYMPFNNCVELKSLKYYLNSFRDEGHFHEEVIHLIEQDLRETLIPKRLTVIGEFNVRGGTHPTIFAGDEIVVEEK
jgi:7-cyano-7-deazaguanine reductase